MGVRHKEDRDIADHTELVAELAIVEKMNTGDRLKHARKRRAHQLKKFSNYEKHLDKSKRKGQSSKKSAPKKSKGGNIHFATNVMLLEAAARNDIEEVSELLSGNVDANVTNEDGLTALHQCCIDDLEEMMELLLGYNGNVNALDTELWTPLHAAATCGHAHLCKTLIEHGADLLAVNADGNMPYDICEDEVTLDYIESEMAKRGVTQELIDDTRLSTEKKMLDDMKELANTGGDLEMLGRSGETPLHIAAANGYIQVAEFLLEHHVSVDATDEDSWQPIHCAACWGHLAVLELLVQHGATLEAKTRSGEAPLDICEDIELKERLLEMKNQLESKGLGKASALSRKHSQNTRSSVVSSSGSIYNSNISLPDKNHISASVRRTSMREKTKLSWKEAQEEKQRLQQITDTPIVVDDDEGIAYNTGASKPSVSQSNAQLGAHLHDIHVQVGAAMLVTDAVTQPSATDEVAAKTSQIDSTNGKDKTNGTISEEVPFAIISGRQIGPTANTNAKKNASSTSLSEEKNASPIPMPRRERRPPSEAASVKHDADVVPAGKTSTTNSNTTLPSPTSARRPSQEPPTGTLADLKKQRATKLADTLKNHSPQMSQRGSESPPAANGHKREVKTQSNNNQPNFYSAGDPPKKKYTAPPPEPGGDRDSSCCVIL